METVSLQSKHFRIQGRQVANNKTTYKRDESTQLHLSHDNLQKDSTQAELGQHQGTEENAAGHHRQETA